MAITVSGYEFEGPFTSTSNLKNKIGVYIIYKKNDNGKYDRMYIGFSEEVKDRVEDSHEKEECWNRETNNNPYFAAFYTSTKQKGLDLETKLINEFKTPCNKQ